MGIETRLTDVFGFMKPLVDVHTMGIFTMANLLRDCGYKVFIASDDVSQALEDIYKINNYTLVKKWILDNRINRIGFSYRLDPKEGCDYFMSLYEHLKGDKMLKEDGGIIKEVNFAGLPDTCEMVSAKTYRKVMVFKGNETPVESLRMYGVPEDLLPASLINDNPYDKMRWEFAEKLIASERYKLEPPLDHLGYAECGKDNDGFVKRLEYAKKKHSLPIIRTHSGPYNPNRMEALKEYNSWCRMLAQTQLLDVLSIGSSQLTQAHFGEKWDGLPNGGGVPVNSEMEYRIIKENASPMLVRTYSGTKDVPGLARIHERALNISWHALSLWWFDELDGRGHNTLLENLKEHFDTVKYIVATGKPVEPNVPHHFAFRGADDISYIVSGYLAAKACNTPASAGPRPCTGGRSRAPWDPSRRRSGCRARGSGSARCRARPQRTGRPRYRRGPRPWRCRRGDCAKNTGRCSHRWTGLPGPWPDTPSRKKDDNRSSAWSLLCRLLRR